MKETRYTGIALDTLLNDNTRILRVWIPELSPFTEGDPSDITAVKTKVINLAQTTQAKFDLTVVSYVECEFYGNANVSRPNIHCGEQVAVRMIEDTQKYYWDTIGRDDQLRTVEYRRILLSNKPSQKDALDPEAGYYMELDTRPPFIQREGETTLVDKAAPVVKDMIKAYATMKLKEAQAQVDQATMFATNAGYSPVANLGSKISANITKVIERINVKPTGRRFKLHLGQGTSEAVGYDIIIDMENSTFNIIDTVGNYILLESLPQQFHVQNANGDFAFIYPNNIRAEIKNGDHIDVTPDNIRMSIKNGDYTNVTKDKVTVNTKTFEVIADDSTFSGTVTVTGATTLKAGLGVIGKIAATSDIVDGGVNTNHHSH